MLNLAILDDNEKMNDKMVKTISGILEKYSIKGEIVTSTTDYRKFLRIISDKRNVTCCILDINLNEEDMNGFTLAKQIREINSDIIIIFFTACLDFIQLAFEVGARGFVPKPQWQQLETTLVRINREIKLEKQKILCIDCNTGDRENFGQYFIPLRDIYYIESSNEKSYVHTVMYKYDTAKPEQATYVTNETLKSLFDRISNENFQFCSRSTIINTAKILSKSNTSITLHDGTICDIGSTFRKNFKDWRPSL